MRKRYLRFLALVMAAVLLFSGCSRLVEEIYQGVVEEMEQDQDWEIPRQEDTQEDDTQDAEDEGFVAFGDMEYIRPDMDEYEQLLDQVCQVAVSSTDIDEVMEQVYLFYDAYDRFCTVYSLADIHYSMDLTDSYWEEEFNYCSMYTAQADMGLEELYYALAKSPILEQLEDEENFGPGFFDYYQQQEGVNQELTALMEQESELESRYYDLSQQAMEVEYYSEEYFSRYGSQMAQLYVELVALRQQMAQVAGYDSYPEFAYDYYHYRDYTPQQAQQYLEQVGQVLAPAYEQWAYGQGWDESGAYCPESQTFRYVKRAAEAMGGSIWEAFQMLEKYELYHIEYGENKYDSSFETYLWSYYQPFVFMNPYMDQSDKLTFAHEFGHFCNDYVCYGSYAGTDVAEVHSQAMEYLSLLYAPDGQELERFKMEDCLETYVEQAAYALFEMQVYQLEGQELTVENVQALYQSIGDRFGFQSWDYDCRDYVNIPHFFTDPMYVISYVVSNDVAVQIYQLELEQPGEGLAVYEACLESMDSYILTFAETYGLESPLAPGRLEKVKATLEQSLGR